MAGEREIRKGKEIPPGYPQGNGMEWLSRRSFRIGNYKFHIPAAIAELLADYELDEDTFYFAKTPNLISRYINRLTPRKRRFRNIVELGVFRGGSAAFLQLTAKPDKLLALELATERVEILDRFIASEGLQDSLTVKYGVDQANVELVRELTTEHIGAGRSIDLVIDDASHLLDATRASFETLFPLLRPGGLYVIEDYSWVQMHVAQYLDRALTGEQEALTVLKSLGLDDLLRSGEKPCHLLAIEAVLASIVAPGLVSKVVADRHWLTIERGRNDVEDSTAFDLRALCNDQFSLLESEPSQRLLEYQTLSGGK